MIVNCLRVGSVAPETRSIASSPGNQMIHTKLLSCKRGGLRWADVDRCSRLCGDGDQQEANQTSVIFTHTPPWWVCWRARLERPTKLLSESRPPAETKYVKSAHERHSQVPYRLVGHKQRVYGGEKGVQCHSQQLFKTSNKHIKEGSVNIFNTRPSGVATRSQLSLRSTFILFEQAFVVELLISSVPFVPANSPRASQLYLPTLLSHLLL